MFDDRVFWQYIYAWSVVSIIWGFYHLIFEKSPFPTWGLEEIQDMFISLGHAQVLDKEDKQDSLWVGLWISRIVNCYLILR